MTRLLLSGNIVPNGSNKVLAIEYTKDRSKIHARSVQVYDAYDCGLGQIFKISGKAFEALDHENKKVLINKNSFYRWVIRVGMQPSSWGYVDGLSSKQESSDPLTSFNKNTVAPHLEDVLKYTNETHKFITIALEVLRLSVANMQNLIPPQIMYTNSARCPVGIDVGSGYMLLPSEDK